MRRSIGRKNGNGKDKINIIIITCYLVFSLKSARFCATSGSNSTFLLCETGRMEVPSGRLGFVLFVSTSRETNVGQDERYMGCGSKFTAKHVIEHYLVW